MAEAVGIGVGVLSFAIQIADSLIKLKNFADSMKSAPDELRRLISGIEEVERILKIVESKDKELGGHAGRHDKLSPSVDNCRQAARRLAEITQKIEKTLLQKPKRGRFQYASSQKSLEAASRQLEVEKATLNVFLSTQTNILAEKVYCQQVSTLVHVQELKEHIERKIESSSSAMADIIRQEISQQVTSLNVDGALTRTSTRPPSSKSTRIRTQELPSALGYIFGAINYSRTKSYHDSKVGTVEELTVRLTTPSWLFGKVYEAHKIQDSWSCKFALRSHNILPPSHAVFRYSEEGNIRGLKQLFSSGRATPFDRDDRGRTPLHM
ncbi:hypothetical protein M7I_6448 [Glarea lozoyensis 74030]|uniref:NACHT-NTPase and P-loop NTPases N-terminal domain-containing protein n=1 Tax=Glarea lozoyensis (strain ATCC 74030 / MF5533) TaxID=1104152 RepID=H0EUL1_GLAL7|nr:hypothetical protein M7I_6448 [Glarea lozoyensis 74030]